jgi:hypothetical protein
VAVTDPLWFTVNEPACKVNVPELDPTAIASGVGAVSTLLMVDTTTLAPPASAFLFKVTVQVLEAFCPRLVGLHESDDTRTGADRLTVVLAELLL